MQEGLFSLPDYNDPKHSDNLLQGKLILGDEDFHSMKLDDLARKVDLDAGSTILLGGNGPTYQKKPHTIQAFLGNEQFIVDDKESIQD